MKVNQSSFAGYFSNWFKERYAPMESGATRNGLPPFIGSGMLILIGPRLPIHGRLNWFMHKKPPQQVTIRDNTSFFGMGSGTGCLVVIGIIGALLMLASCVFR